MSDYTTLSIERHGHRAEVILDRAHKLNAINRAMFADLRRAFDALDADPDVWVVVLRGNGRMFTAGLDLIDAMNLLQGPGDPNASQAVRSEHLYRVIKDLQASVNAIANCRKPTIAAVHGRCIGGGVDIVTACDIRVASADVAFSVFETRIAIVADVGTLQRLTPIVGKGMAREMAFTGANVGADRALRTGLVNDVFDDADALLAGARALADSIAANSPIAVQGTKRVMDYSDAHGVEAGLEFVAHWNTARLQSNDLAEALTAFLEKRDGVYTGA